MEYGEQIINQRGIHLPETLLSCRPHDHAPLSPRFMVLYLSIREDLAIAWLQIERCTRFQDHTLAISRSDLPLK